MTLAEKVARRVDRERLVETATRLVDIWSPTGHERPAADFMVEQMEEAGLEVTLQEVEENRANAVGRLRGRGNGPSLMFNGHLDTSYRGDEPWLDGPGFKARSLVRDDVILGLGIMNMKGAVACYVEAARALLDAGVRLEGDVVIAAVAGEIEKAQWSSWGEEYVGPEYRGYGCGTRHLVANGVLADACILGEPTEERLVLGHFGSMWVRLSTEGPFFHTAFSYRRSHENSIVRMREVLDAVLEWSAEWEKKATYQGLPGVVNIGSVRGGFPWRVSRTPHRTDLFLDLRVPPTMPMLEAQHEVDELVGTLQQRYPDHGIGSEVFVTSPGAEVDPGHAVVRAADAGHRAAYGTPPERDYVRWASDASTLTKHGVAALNYGPISSALPGPEGESVPIDSLVRIATSYAVAATEFCGVSR